MARRLSKPNPTKAAWTARAELGLSLESPIEDLVKLLEEAAQIPTSIVPLPDTIPCAYVETEGRGFIFANASHEATDRRFALAHALAHHYLEHGDVLDSVESLESPTESAELEANEFASEFLAPQQAVTTALSRWDYKRVDPMRQPVPLWRFADFFGLSPQLAMSRLASTRHLVRKGSTKAEQHGRGDAETLPETAGWQKTVEEFWRSTGSQGTSATYRWGASSMAEARSQPFAAPEPPAQSTMRLPAEMRRNAVAAYMMGLAPLTRLADALRTSPADLEKEFRDLGIEGPDPIPGY